jgi:4-amino-4-deoxychorismate lyase
MSERSRLLSRHSQRLQGVIQAKFLQFLFNHEVQIRILLAQSGQLSATATPIQPFTTDPTCPSFFNPETEKPPPQCDVVDLYVDTQPTPTSLFTSTKTTRREVYNEARSRAGITPSSDVILYNPNDLLTEASIYNVAIYRSSKWITPSASTGCLTGVFRRWLLEQGRIHEDIENSLTRDCVKQGEWVLLFNGVQGCRLGRIVPHYTR